MDQGQAWAQYEKRIERVIAHIYAHLDNDLDMAAVAEIACLSSYHWHRIYRAVQGETVTQTVKRLRLHRAANWLANSTDTIASIARRSGYPNLQSFTRAFGKAYGLPPARFRQMGSHTLYPTIVTKGDPMSHTASIRTPEPQSLAGLAHHGSYLLIGQAFDRLSALAGARGLFGKNTAMIGVYFDDPAVTPEDRLRSFAGITIGADTVVETPLERLELPGGRYAVMIHKGPYSDLPTSYQWLYGPWLKQSGEALRDAPCFDRYLNDPRQTTPAQLLTEIWLPLK